MLKETTKKTIGDISILIVIGMSIFLIFMFFQNYQFIYLISAFILPIFSVMFTSQYCAGNLTTILISTLGLVGFITLDEPYKIISIFLSIYIILYKIHRYGHGFIGNYNDIEQIKINEIIFLKKLFTSEWYIENKNKSPKEIDINSLINQPYYKINISIIISLFIKNNYQEFSKSKYNKKNLIRIHALGTIHTLPKPILKNDEGLISTGTQLFINIFKNIKSINEMDDIIKSINQTNLDFDEESIIPSKAKELLQKSINQYNEVTESDINSMLKNTF